MAIENFIRKIQQDHFSKNRQYLKFQDINHIDSNHHNGLEKDKNLLDQSTSKIDNLSLNKDVEEVKIFSYHRDSFQKFINSAKSINKFKRGTK